MSTAGPGGAGQGGGRPAGDAREQARRLRAVPAGQVLGDLLLRMLTAARVKLGRRDARLLAGVAAVAHEQARPHLPGELTRQSGPATGRRHSLGSHLPATRCRHLMNSTPRGNRRSACFSDGEVMSSGSFRNGRSVRTGAG